MQERVLFVTTVDECRIQTGISFLTSQVNVTDLERLILFCRCSVQPAVVFQQGDGDFAVVE